MRILLITIWKPNRGGIVTHVENLIRHSKNEFKVLTYGGGIDLPFLRALSFVFFGFLGGVRENFDLIHAHYAVPQGFLGVLLKKVLRKPLVVTLHGSDITVLGRGAAKPLMSFVLNNSDAIIAVSEFLRRETINLGASKEKIKVIYGGAPYPPMSRLVEKLQDGRRITFIGSLVRQKGVDVLIRAFVEVKKKLPDAELVIVGDGREKKSLEKLSSELGIEVNFLGYREDLSSILEKSAVLVLPSKEEGFGLTLLEAMAVGVPVVASRVGGIEEIIEHEYNGILFEKENSKELAEGIIRILENKEL
ncbi:MAG: glycosyltransferase family 4 protein, partial [Euryarchaeota archaeon]|nr:glycosyltransferase family 4 protein [Euryarchaeota archaeon]